jgi:hypothetical protein
MCVIQQVKKKLYVEFRVTFIEILYSSFVIGASVDQERSAMTKKKKKKKEKKDVEKNMVSLDIYFKES